MYLTGVHLGGRRYLSRPTRIVSPADKLSNCVPRYILVPRDNITVVPDKIWMRNTFENGWLSTLLKDPIVTLPFPIIITRAFKEQAIR
jgi:hypothetical protein